ncbi:hypothetical protein BIBE0010001c01_00012 [Bifidobacterium phage BigBern1]|nr:hypothetical protein BIBE0010001c01_00012 [Bifidobacterium phage BigBern1]
MRIRSIKPEFWRSDDIDALSIPDRLLFIGLWSYVDDNGVGLFSLKDIAADLFAGDMARDSQETLQRVSEGLGTLSRHHLIEVYRVDEKDYLHITNWSRHQKITHPGKVRYPLPDKGSEPPLTLFTETLQRPSGDSLAWNRGTGEQGNRGTVPPIAPQGGRSESEPETHEPTSEPTKSFEQFWSLYPNHDYPDAAVREFKRVLRRTGTERVTLVALLQGAQMLRDEHRDPRYIPSASKWLHDGGWKNRTKPRAQQRAPAASRSQQNQDSNAALIARYAQEEAAQSRKEIPA